MATTTSLTANYRRQQGGFTLIEIAIVLAIIGLLIAALTAARGIQDSAEQNRAVAWMESWVNAAQDFENRYGPIDFDEITPADISGSVNVTDSNIQSADNTQYAFAGEEILVQVGTGGEFAGDQNFVRFNNVPEVLAAELDRAIDGSVDGTTGRVQGGPDDAGNITEGDTVGELDVAIPPLRDGIDD